MDLAQELVAQQVFFRRELSERVGWFIGLRWMAVGAAAAGLAGSRWAGLHLPWTPILAIILAIAAYNGIFLLVCRYQKRFSPDHPRPFVICAHSQILCDLTALFGLIHFTGGFYSPLVLFALFHIILAAILLEPGNAYLYSGLVLFALAVMAIAQTTGGRIDSHPLVLSPWGVQGEALPGGTIAVFLIRAVIIATVAFLVTTIKISLRTKGRTLLVFCKELEAANSKLTALYGMIKEMADCVDSRHLMDCATQSGARIMGVKACSIKLLDDQGEMLRFASTYGLSQNYLAKGEVAVDKSPINQRIIDGAVYAIGKIEEQDYFQYPEDIVQEGIRSMICLPLKVGKRVLGVFCVYSQASFCFSDRDVEFFALMAELTALAMQNLTNELNKSWFLQKSAHQLRSPLNAVNSMLKTLRKAYAGPLTDEQIELLVRCERRLESLSRLVNDLLELSLARSDSGRLVLGALDLGAALRSCLATFLSQAKTKAVAITIAIDDNLPPIKGEPTLVDHVLTNLISNAVKYTPPGKSIAVTLTREDGDRLRLEVADSGIGIAETEIAGLFTEFFRGQNAKALTEEGSGLGLVIVREAMDKLRGSVRIQSRLGLGTQVVCRFPIAGPADNGAGSPPTPVSPIRP